MAYTVKEVAKLSGVSVRTLHFYDEIGLLEPAYINDSGYRYYQEKELLQLQQILFFRELGFELKKIKKILGKGDFDTIHALQAHRKVLQSNVQRTKKLIVTIDKTIKHLSGGKKMKDTEMYQGFTKEKQEEYEQYLINRVGEKIKAPIEASKKNMKNWSKEEWAAFSKEWESICKELADLLFKKSMKADSEAVQKVIRRHYKWLPWTGTTCTKEAYIGLGEGYRGFEWKKTFEVHDPHHPRLATFMAEAMAIFANRELA